MHEEHDAAVPELDDWQPECEYADYYGKEEIREYLKRQKENYQHKHGQLYIWGPKNTFKTTTINQIAAEEKWRVFEAPQSMREWNGFDPRKYDLIIWDEFDSKQVEYNRKRLLQLLEGQNVTLDVKCLAPTTFNVRKAKIPIVLLSN